MQYSSKIPGCRASKSRGVGTAAVLAPLVMSVLWFFTGVVYAQEPIRGGTLIIGQSRGIETLDPAEIRSSDVPFKWQIYDTLVRMDSETRELVPALAESWELSDDGLTLTFQLRRGVLFHDESELTAEAVAANIRRIQDPDAGSKLRDMALAITSIDTPDPYTLVLGYDEPNVLTFEFILGLWIGEPSTLDDPTRAIGTGPFQLSELTLNDRMVMDRFEAYWKDELPYLDRVEIRFLPDEQALAANLQANAINVATFLPLTSLEALKADPRFDIVTANTDLYAIGLNVSTPPLDNKLVRQALNQSMNRERFASVFLQGTSEPQCVPWPETSVAYSEEQANACSFDLEEARRLLDEAGQDDFSLTVEVSPETTPDMVRFVQVWQQDLAELGINLNIETISRNVYSEKIRNSGFEQAWVQLHGASLGEPARLFAEPRPFLPEGNPSNFSSQEYTRLVEEMRTADDLERRRELYHEVTDLLLEEAFINSVAFQPQITAYTSNLHGLGFDPNSKMLLESAWLEP